MAVYTDVDRDSLEGFLKSHYDLGPVKTFKGIPEGIENSNFYLETETGRFILTLFEKRSPEKDLPFFIKVMAHLSEKGVACPLPISGKDGRPLFRLKNKPALIVSFLEGEATTAPTPEHALNAGRRFAEMHQAMNDFSDTRPNPLDLSGLEKIYQKLSPAMDRAPAEMKALVKRTFSRLGKQNLALPGGVIHADLFPDNVFFKGHSVTGIIDFYFAAEDALAYDLAIALNSWCFKKDGTFLPKNFVAMIRGYESLRPLEKMEKDGFPDLLCRGALRFLLTRLEDFLFPQDSAMGIIKDPGEYGKILSFHLERRHIGDYR